MRAPIRSRHAARRSGFSLIELLFGTAILVVLAGALAVSMNAMSSMTATGKTQEQLQAMGRKAIDRITTDLKRSGSVTLTTAAGDVDFPYLFDDGNATGYFTPHAHLSASSDADPNDYDFGPNREIVFLQPADADANGVPDIDANGELVWDAGEFSYTLVTRGNGNNVLERRADVGATPHVVARFVERVVFDDQLTSGFVVPLESIRVRIFFRKPDDTGTVHRHFVEATVRLRNG